MNQSKNRIRVTTIALVTSMSVAGMPGAATMSAADSSARGISLTARPNASKPRTQNPMTFSGFRSKLAAMQPSLSADKLKLTVGDTQTLTVKNVKPKDVLRLKVKSTKKSVASVKKKNKTKVRIKAKKAGRTKIRVILKVDEDGDAKKYRLNCKVTVRKAEPVSTAKPTATPNGDPVSTAAPASTQSPTATPVPTLVPVVTAAPSAIPSATPEASTSPAGSGGSSSSGGSSGGSSGASRILSGLSLIYNNYATYVGGCEGINPVYTTYRPVAEDFSVWKYLRMTVADRSVAEVGKDGLVIGKKAGATQVTIAATDGSGQKVTATLKVVEKESDLTERDDYFRKTRYDYMQKVMSNWNDNQKRIFNNGDLWSQDMDVMYKYYDRINTIYDDYTARGLAADYTSNKPADSSPQDSLASITSTAAKMLPDDDSQDDETEEAAFFNTLKTNITERIKSASSLEELRNLSKEFVSNGLDGLVSLSGFNTDNYSDLDPMYIEPEQIPDEGIDMKYYYISALGLPEMPAVGVLNNFLEGLDDTVERYLRIMLTALGMGVFADADGNYLDADREVLDCYKDENFNSLIELLRQLAEANDEDEENNRRYKDVCEAYPNLDIAGHFSEKGSRASHISVGYDDVSEDSLVEDRNKNCLEILNEYMADPGNLSVMKLFLAVTATAKLVPYTYKHWYAEVSSFSGSEEPESDAKDYLTKKLDDVMSLIPFDLDQIYTQIVYTDAHKEKIESLIKLFQEYYIDAIKDSDYSEKAKNHMLDKIRNLKTEILYPDEDAYKNLQLGRAESGGSLDLETASEGGTLVGNLITIFKYYAHLEDMTVGSEAETIEWWHPDVYLFDSLTPWENNATCISFSNKIVISHGGIGPDTFIDFIHSDDATMVENIGHMTFSIGHEMGHLFDSYGIWFDKNGKIQNPWEPGEAEKNNTRTDKLKSVFDSLLMWGDTEKCIAYYKNPGVTIDEAMADLSGAEIALRIVKDKYPDHVQRLFESMSEYWTETDGYTYRIRDLESEDGIAIEQQEEHPFARQRVNGIVSMMNDFYLTVGVGETDSMYVAPENRVELWKPRVA